MEDMSEDQNKSESTPGGDAIGRVASQCDRARFGPVIGRIGAYWLQPARDQERRCLFSVMDSKCSYILQTQPNQRYAA